MKTIKARKIEVPFNMTELLDKRAGNKAGILRDIIAELGELHSLDKYALRMAMGVTVKYMLETDELPEKPMSLKRFTQMMWVMIVAYTLGTMSVDEDGEVHVGTQDDISFIGEVLSADYFEFRNGKRVPATSVLPRIQDLTSEGVLKEVFETIAGKGLRKRNRLSPEHALRIAGLIMQASDLLAGETEI